MVAELDADLATFLREAADAGAPSITAGTVEQARTANAAFLRSMRSEPSRVADVADIRVPTRTGEVAARRYTPSGHAAGVVLYFHGGGWVLGDLEGHDQICRQVAAESASIVINVDYRHAPEVPFPGAVDDAVDALTWANAAHELPIVLMGDSAGGNLAASAAVTARNHGIDVACQVLLYPVTDADSTTESHRRNGDGYLITNADLEWFWTHYVPDGDRFDPRVSVLRTEDLTNVAPAVVVVAGFDPLYDEGVAYAGRLRSAGVSCELLDYPGAIHGFMTMFAISPLAEQAVSVVTTKVTAALSSH